MFKDWKIRNLMLVAMLAMVLPLSLFSAMVDYRLHKGEELRQIDLQLFTAATMAEATLTDDFHDRITGPDSVSPEEFNLIVDRNNRLCEELNMEYLWSLMLVDGVPVFTSSTSPDKQVENGLQAGFFEPHSNPELYEKVFQTMEPQFKDNVDKWGRIRAALIPHEDAHGRKYLFGASKKLADIHTITPALVRDVLLTCGVFLIPGILISLAFSKRLTRPISKLAEAATLMRQGDLETRIQVEGSREISVVSDSMDLMRESIARHIELLKNSFKELQEFRDIVNSSPTIVYRLRFDPGAWPVEFVSENVHLLGYTTEELETGTVAWSSLTHPDDLAAVEALVKEKMAAGTEDFNLEARIITKDGRVRWMQSWNRFIMNEAGEATHIHGIFTDITEKKEAQERDVQYRERLKALTQDLMKAEDTERRRLAIAIHDNLGQMLTALNMKLTVLKETSSRELIDDLVLQVDTLLEHIMQSCRTMTWEISPPSLYETDIVAGLERMAAEVGGLFGIEVQIQPLETRLELSREATALLFRCAKELLVNCAKHAGTHRAQVTIIPLEDRVRLIVADSGSGFDPAELENGSKPGFGLFSIKERLLHLNGLFSIESEPGRGTTVTIEIPA